MKKLVFLFAAFATLVASAQTKVEIDGIWYNLVSKAKQAEVTTGSTKYSGSITIPATVTYEDVQYSVTSIGRSAFAYCSSLTSITIPESVINIGSSAFYYCSSLTNITIPKSVTSIGGSAFDFCSSLTAVHISDIAAWCNIKFSDGYSTPLSLAHNLYLNGELVTELTIPEGVASIGQSAFHGCSTLTAINIPESVTSIGDEAFRDCSNLTAINIPENVTSIGGWTFQGCSSLTGINIPENVESIGICTFKGCSSLTAITLPPSVTTIGNSFFSGCSSLTTITIPESVTTIDYSAFSGCSSLTTITIPESVTTIGESAFQYCGSLTAIVLPKNIKDIYSKAFANCGELLDVYCYAESIPAVKSNAFNGSYPEYATLHVPAASLNAYKSTVPWSNFGSIVELGATITRITLDKTSATLTEGDELALTATITPNDTTNKTISWTSSNPSVATVDNTGKVTAVAPGTATITAMANDGSEVSASCEVTVNKLILGKCTTPTISYTDGKVIFACDTEGVTFVSETTENLAGNRHDTEFTLIPTYTITAYATKENYENSDIATLTLCWIPCTEEHESEEDGILTIPSKPVLISTQGGTITVSGLAADTEVTAYSTAGTLLATATATDGTATLATSLTMGSTAIVKIGEHSIKVVIK